MRRTDSPIDTSFKAGDVVICYKKYQHGAFIINIGELFEIKYLTKSDSLKFYYDYIDIQYLDKSKARDFTLGFSMRSDVYQDYFPDYFMDVTKYRRDKINRILE